ncbi:MAG: biotin--[acetyl-CoA-carboxylase] ligase [Gammaproteobacteria bacterium]|nr:biotin--[acetyl-CoA-carboxylase] ligase [Gammaproteobacteria bacterium]
MTLLDAEQIRAPIPQESRERLELLEVFAEIDSTNSHLLNQPAPQPGRFRVALAEHQTAGRGRRDKRWHSAGSSGLCLSMAYTFASPRLDLSAVTLAAGVGIAGALELQGTTGIGLKWPNDLVVRNGKLGGILTEVRRRPGGQATIVVGVGINIDLGGSGKTQNLSSSIGQVSDLASCGVKILSRSALSAALIEKLFDTLVEFEASGFAVFADAYDRHDWLKGRTISVDMSDGPVDGLSEGVDLDGALIIRTDAGLQRILSGSVRLPARGH